MKFLKESHPERLKDKRFIISCTNAATEAYEHRRIFMVRLSGLHVSNPQKKAAQRGLVGYNVLHTKKPG